MRNVSRLAFIKGVGAIVAVNATAPSVTVRAPEGAKPDVRFAGKPVAYKIAR